MRKIKILMGSLILISGFIHAEESAIDKTKDSAVELWKNAKEATVELVGKASETGNEASTNIKATGVIVWDAMKEAGVATAQSAKKGIAKIRQLSDGKNDQKNCNKDSALCYKDKE